MHREPETASGDSIRAHGGDHRLETFVDAAFAFALTLLVISFDDVPESYAELREAMLGIPAFAACFGIIVMLWIGHHAWSRRYELADTTSVLLSLTLVFVVMIYVYPLRAMMSTGISAMSGGYLPGSFRIESIDGVRGLFTIYGSGFLAAVGCIASLYLHALRSAERLGLTARERSLAGNEAVIWSTVAGMGLVSIVLAQTLPDRLVGMAGLIYALLAVVAPVLGIGLARRTERLTGSAPEDERSYA